MADVTHIGPLETQLQATLNKIPAYTWYAAPTGGLTFVNTLDDPRNSRSQPHRSAGPMTYGGSRLATCLRGRLRVTFRISRLAGTDRTILALSGELDGDQLPVLGGVMEREIPRSIGLDLTDVTLVTREGVEFIRRAVGRRGRARELPQLHPPVDYGAGHAQALNSPLAQASDRAT